MPLHNPYTSSHLIATNYPSFTAKTPFILVSLQKHEIPCFSGIETVDVHCPVTCSAIVASVQV